MPLSMLLIQLPISLLDLVEEVVDGTGADLVEDVPMAGEEVEMEDVVMAEVNISNSIHME